MGKQWEQWLTLFCWAPKSLQIVTAAMKLKDTYSLERKLVIGSVQQLSCVRLCDPMNHSTPGLPVHHQLLEFTQTHVHKVGDAIQPLILCHPLLLLPPIPPSIRERFQMSQLFTSGAIVLEFQLQHQSLQ